MQKILILVLLLIVADVLMVTSNTCYSSNLANRHKDDHEMIKNWIDNNPEKNIKNIFINFQENPKLLPSYYKELLVLYDC